MNVKDSIRRHTALISIVILAFACGQANSRSPAPAPTPSTAPTTPAPKKPKKIATGTRTTPAARPPAAATPASPTPPTNTVATTKTLSLDYSVNCARCHGQNGDGRVNIKGKSYQEYKDAVRSGRGSMPAFDTSQYSDASLNNDHSVLSGN